MITCITDDKYTMKCCMLDLESIILFYIHVTLNLRQVT